VHDARLDELGLVLPGPFPPPEPLEAVVVHGSTATTSACLPITDEGAIYETGILGRDLAPHEGAECAALCALNALALLRSTLGSLDTVERVLTVRVFMACTDDFVEHGAVADGASRVLEHVFGPAGRHARSAVGVRALAGGAPVAIEVTVALRG
jgi:enamine deaminase RidA (YjgF/YER057c/UK114 family)